MQITNPITRVNQFKNPVKLQYFLILNTQTYTSHWPNDDSKTICEVRCLEQSVWGQ